MTGEREPSIWGSFKRSLSKTSAKLNEGLKNILGGGKVVDEATLRSLKNLLITTDMGPEVAAFFTQQLNNRRFTDAEYQVKQALAQDIESFLVGKAKPILAEKSPHIVMLCGVNGSGKTTTVAKLAHKFQKEGKSVLIGACDTFRAAAVSQLELWANRISCPIVSGALGADAASIAYKTVEKALKENIDVVLVDTAGRLHNNKNLMEELAKVCRTIRKLDESAPHNTVLVLDATVGQNTLAQVEAFSSFVNVDGIILTKLDGTAKGGIVLRVVHKYNLDLHAVGVGEGIDDLEIFSAAAFSRGLLELT
ncbi:signal recognition particle-docking protein FtsY [Anaplasma platys]|nr:signal recognition particle-docking protein FtsY [Anaplasma platys]